MAHAQGSAVGDASPPRDNALPCSTAFVAQTDSGKSLSFYYYLFNSNVCSYLGTLLHHERMSAFIFKPYCTRNFT